MNYETALLVGGPSDGVRMSVLEGVPSLRMAIHGVPGIDSVGYRREELQGVRGYKGVVYVIDNGLDGVSALVEGYHGGRAAFEDLASARGYNTEQFDGRYVSKITQGFWECWQAARSAGTLN